MKNGDLVKCITSSPEVNDFCLVEGQIYLIWEIFPPTNVFFSKEPYVIVYDIKRNKLAPYELYLKRFEKLK